MSAPEFQQPSLYEWVMKTSERDDSAQMLFFPAPKAWKDGGGGWGAASPSEGSRQAVKEHLSPEKEEMVSSAVRRRF